MVTHLCPEVQTADVLNGSHETQAAEDVLHSAGVPTASPAAGTRAAEQR